jgi:hypothetical protein
VSADEELQKTLALEGAGGFAALESADSNEALPPGIDESDIDGENV